MSDTFYIVVDPEGSHHQDDPSEWGRFDETQMRLFANPKNWMQQQRRPSECGITGSRLFEIHFDGEFLKVVAEFDQSGKELWRE